MKNQSKKTVRVIHSKSQKVWGVLALTGLFVCGIMVGLGFAKKQIVIQQQAQEQKIESKDTCAVIEEIQMNYLIDETVSDVRAHENNIRVYETLFQHGCPENKQKYRDLISREMQILDSLNGTVDYDSVCEELEASLLERMPAGGVDASAGDRINRAKIYANLSERGCEENKQKYVDLAAQELEIARALRDDNFSQSDTIEVVETYKRLEMQAAAQEVFDMAKKLTNPAIDFIIEVEKIINQ